MSETHTLYGLKIPSPISRTTAVLSMDHSPHAVSPNQAITCFDISLRMSYWSSRAVLNSSTEIELCSSDDETRWMSSDSRMEFR